MLVNEKNNLNAVQRRSHNERFGAMAAVIPQTILLEIASYYPAGSSVEAATAPSRWALYATRDSAVEN